MGHRLTTDQARARFAAAPVARLATVSHDGRPHLVPITFSVTGDLIHTPIDHKPKRTTSLKRLENVAANPAVSVLVDHYEREWRGLWWVRADGRARALEPGSSVHAAAARALAEKYPQYRAVPVTGVVIEIRVARWSSWTADPTPET